MDHFSLIISVVVVVLVLIIIYIAMTGDFLCISTGHVIVKSPNTKLQQIHLKDTGCSTDNTFTADADTLTCTQDISKNKTTQIEDSELFITCYDHIQAQHEENLIATDTLENIVYHFNESLMNILKHSDVNFQILAYQLRSEFHGYMQYALTQASAMAIPVLEPVDFQTLQTNYQEKQEQIPNLHIEHYAIYKQHELQDTEEEIQCQAEGARPKDPTHPW